MENEYIKMMMDLFDEEEITGVSTVWKSFFNPPPTFEEKISKSLDKYWIFRGKKRKPYIKNRMVEIDIVRGGK